MGLFKTKFFGSGSGSTNAEPTLDKIVSDAAAENEYALYKLVNYRRGGSILEAYAAPSDVGGVKAVDQICEEMLKDYMYFSGNGGIILGSDCLAWRSRKRGEVFVSMSRKVKKPKNEANDRLPCHVPTDHVGCWLLEQRGVLGENPLHILVICDTPTHTKVAKILLRHFPKLAMDVMECCEYYGLSPLHLAVAYNNMELVQALVQAGANVNERATGRFFMPSDQKERLKKKTNYSGFTYLGEYPLSWAACCENEAVYNYLLDRGADPNLQDTFGNMVLHMVVISNKLGMYGYALRHPKKPANNELLNRAGLTPLTLACTLGRNNIFCEMLELSSQEFWRFSNITCSAYPLIALDSIGPDGRTNWKSALMIILNGESDEHLNMLEGGVVLRLLDDKWKTFARNQFLIRLGFLFLHLLVLSIAVYLRPKFGESLGWNEDPKSIIRHCAEVVTIISCATFVFVQQGSELRSQGVFQFITNLVRSPAKLFFLISNIAIMLCIPFRVFKMRLVEDTILTFALPGTWFFLMFFAGSVRLTGAFVTMIYSMIAGDMVRFGFIYVIALIGFSQAFFFLFKSCRIGIQEADETNIDMYETYYGTWMALFQMTLGRYQFSDFSKPKYSGLSMGFFVVFMILVPILLLNVLIAMMSSTYSNVISKSEKEFVKQWAKIVLAVERSVAADKAKEHLNAYAINLAPPPGFDTDSGMEFKGLMVIKSKSKTKAQQRKGALLNWRRMGKRLVGEMRKYNCKGNELLRMMKDETVKKAPRRGSLAQLFDSVDQDQDPSAAPQKGGLGEALSQLAFAHDIDITGVTTNAPVSPSEVGGNKCDSKMSFNSTKQEILPNSQNENEGCKSQANSCEVNLVPKAALVDVPKISGVVQNQYEPVMSVNTEHLQSSNVHVSEVKNSNAETFENARSTELKHQSPEKEQNVDESKQSSLQQSSIPESIITIEPNLNTPFCNFQIPLSPISTCAVINDIPKISGQSSIDQLQNEVHEQLQISKEVLTGTANENRPVLTQGSNEEDLAELEKVKEYLHDQHLGITRTGKESVSFEIDGQRLKEHTVDQAIAETLPKAFKESLNEMEAPKRPYVAGEPLNDVFLPTIKPHVADKTEILLDASAVGEVCRPKTAPHKNSDGDVGAESFKLKKIAKLKRRVMAVSTPTAGKGRRTGIAGKMKKFAAKVEPSPEEVSTVETQYEEEEEYEEPSRPHTSVHLGRGLNRWNSKPVVSLECLLNWNDNDLDRESP